LADLPWPKVGPVDQASPTILVIDDDDIVRDSVRVLLETRNFTVTDFASADAFLRHEDGLAADCIVLDLHMPGMTGLELLKRLRTLGDQTPVILVTGRPDATTQAEARALGVPLLEKPISAQLLFATIGGVLGHRPR